MNSDRSQQLSIIFERLVAADSRTRKQEIEKLAEEDESIAKELEAMLDADRNAKENSFLEIESEFSHQTIAFENSFSQLKPQSMFGQYRLQDQLGFGGMGVVYSAYDTIAKRTVALKIVKPNLVHDGEMQARAVNEAYAAAKLSHPNIVPIFDVGVEGDVFYFTMPLFEAGDLKSASVFQYVDSESTAELFLRIAQGLTHAHQQGVIHRDIKPGNIMLDENDKPMIVDFGLAKNRDNHELQTETGRLMGSANYMPPEQIVDSSRVTERSDVYSFGATLYECLAGSPPFDGNDLMELFQKIQNIKPDRPSSLNPRVDARLESICLRCLEKSPENRYQSMQEVVDELERVRQGKPLSDKSTLWNAVNAIAGFRQVGHVDLKTQPSARWVFAHNLVTHVLVWVVVFWNLSPIYLWGLVLLATLNLGAINWHFHWSNYWHLEITERLSAIGLLMANFSFVALLFIHGPLDLESPSEVFVEAYPAISLIFAILLSAHGSIHAGKWLTCAMFFLPLAVILPRTELYAPLIFAVASSLATLAIVFDLESSRKAI